MTQESPRTAKIIDEDGTPVIDVDSRTGKPDDSGIPGWGVPGAAGMPGLPPIPDELLNRKGKLSIVKLMGWKGIAIAVLIVGALIGLAALSVMVAVIALPILLLIGVVGWVAAKVGGPKRAGGAPRTVLVVRR